MVSIFWYSNVDYDKGQSPKRSDRLPLEENQRFKMTKTPIVKISYSMPRLQTNKRMLDYSPYIHKKVRWFNLFVRNHRKFMKRLWENVRRKF